MDYEKKYKEALEWMRDLYPTMEGMVKEDAEHYFPELKESVDEQIRRRLFAILEWAKSYPSCGFTSNEIGEVLAWLEKQGEPTEINPSEFDSRLNKLLKQFETLPKEELESIIAFYLNVVQNDGTYKEEKQGKQNQKHFELKAGHWYICHRAFCCRADHLTVKEGERFMCEKDGIVKGFVIKEPEKYFKEVCAPAPIEDEQKPTIEMKSAEESLGIDSETWNKVVDESIYGEQKPAKSIVAKEALIAQYQKGWEDALHQLPEEIDSQIWQIANNSAKTFQESVAILIATQKGYNKGKKDALNKQKPTEWGKEDDQYLLVCKNALYKYQSTDKWDATIIYNWLCNRLKALRPQKLWKPTEEQMEALYEETQKSDRIKDDRIVSLYNNLKKLKEG